MAEETLTVTADLLDEVLGGAPDEIDTQMREAIAVLAAASRGPAEDAIRAVKLRGAFTTVTDWLLAKRVPALSEAQWLFLSTGAAATTVRFEGAGPAGTLEMVPRAVYDALKQARAAKAARPAWAAPILDVEDRIRAIGRGELVGMDSAQSRRRKPAKPLGADQMKDKAKGRLENLGRETRDAIAQVESALNAFATLREEKVLAGVKLNLEVLKKYAQIAGAGAKNDGETRLLASVNDKLGGLALSAGTLGGQLAKAGEDLTTRGKMLEGKLADLKVCRDEVDRLEAGGAPAAGDEDEVTYDQDTIAAMRKDADTIASFAVKAAETADNKNAWSGSRILVKTHWEGFGVPAADCLATVPAVVAAIEKIGKIHVNIFPKDADGSFVLPPILIEPIRNFVEFFDDRIIMSFVSGEAPRKGPKISLTPVEVQVLKACGQWLCKDALYDYRGEVNSGTFMGDYSGKMEKKTQVKWTGEDKKLTMAVTSQMADTSSRGEAVNDYADSFFALANGQNPPNKMSRRKLAVMLRYVILESVEKTIGYCLMHCAQQELMETKDTIMKHARTETNAKELVTKALQDPLIGRSVGDKDFVLTKLFGKQA